MSTINPDKGYTLKEIISEKLIPKVKGYSALYKLITVLTPSKKNLLGVTRSLVKETSNTKIKATHSGNPWNKINGKITVEGKEIIKFLKLNNLF
jgi:hypothetical protein